MWLLLKILLTLPAAFLGLQIGLYLHQMRSTNVRNFDLQAIGQQISQVRDAQRYTTDYEPAEGATMIAAAICCVSLIWLLL